MAAFLSDAFGVSAEPWGRALRCRVLPARHLFSTRDIDVRVESPGAAEAWAAVAASMDVPPRSLLRAHQVHGRDIVIVRKGDACLPEPGGVDADVLVTNAPEVAVTVRVADCVPLLIADPVTGAVGAAHAGWKGTALGVASEAVSALARAFGSRPADLHVALGPSIGPEVYEVGEEVRAVFRSAGHGEQVLGRWFLNGTPRPRLDVWQANVDQLVQAGVPAAQIYAARACTATHRDWFFSHRGEGAGTGRMVAAIRAGDVTQD